MSRTSDDSWDLSESVGVTALGAADARARETNRENALIHDPYAKLFVDAAAARGVYYPSFDDEFMAQVREIDPLMVQQLRAQWTYMGSRTKWFDEFFTAAGAAGVRQAVILAAGLDSRTWRLPWAEDSVVFEIDQPKVLEFKVETLRANGVEPSCRYLAIGIDLRDDWPTALCDNGFDPNQPSAWSAEGLLSYLPSDAQDLLFNRIQKLSAQGSCIAVDDMGAAFLDRDRLARLATFFGRFREVVHRTGGQLPDTAGMWFDENRVAVADWLRGHGWCAELIGVRELMAGYDRNVPDEEAVGIPLCEFVSGRLDAN